MTLTRTVAALAAASLLTSVSPAFAQRQGGGNRGGGEARGGGARSGQAAPSGRSGQRSSGPGRSYSAPRSYSGSSRSYSSRPYVYNSPRGYSSGNRAYGGGFYGGGSRGSVVIRGGRSSYGGRVVVSSGRFYRPYYTFRPRVSLGFGLWVGYPVAYPYYYDDPYYYDPYGYSDPYYYPSAPYPAYPPAYPPYPSSYPPYSSAYPSQYPSYPSSSYPSSRYPSSRYPSSQYPSNYPPPSASRAPQYPAASGSASVGVRPGQQSGTVGGVSFDITPDTAEVYVDGSLTGTVREFTPSSRPLDLPPGHHRIEIRASGYRTLTFDENIVAGEVLPFQGTMER